MDDSIPPVHVEMRDDPRAGLPTSGVFHYSISVIRNFPGSINCGARGGWCRGRYVLGGYRRRRRTHFEIDGPDCSSDWKLWLTTTRTIHPVLEPQPTQKPPLNLGHKAAPHSQEGGAWC